MSSSIVSPIRLDRLRSSSHVLIIDVRFDLSDPAKGEREYAVAHVPGAVYAHLDKDLSGPSESGLGRHPLPEDARLSAALARWGWRPGQDTVVYDGANGALAAARLWWLLKLAGHDRVAVLDGGLSAWQLEGLPLEATAVEPPMTRVNAVLDRSAVVWSAELERRIAQQRLVLIDARAAPRYRGEVEPIDPVAGHVPGAINRPFSDNLTADGRFKPAEQLRKEFAELLRGAQPTEVVHMCGSGVTACHNLLAMEHAGFHGSRIYAPSWSGWIADGHRPVTRGG